MNKVFPKIDEENVAKRLDKYLVDFEPTLSRTEIQRLIEANLILVNDLPSRANYRLRIDDVITLTIVDPVEYEIEPVNLNLDIVYEDSYVAIINKPAGMIVHPSSTTKEPTLVHGIMYQIKDLSGINGVLRPGIVHRIDKDTSGLLMIAKNDLAHESLVTQLTEKTIVRRYLALVYGNFDHNLGRVDAPIGRNPNDRIRMGVVHDGKEAVTHFSVLERFKDYTLIECRLETGRTHQIRVHMQYIGHPLVGDPLYGPRKVIGEHGQFLHAQIIGFVHPKTKEYMEFKAELPEYYEAFLNELRNENK